MRAKLFGLVLASGFAAAMTAASANTAVNPRADATPSPAPAGTQSAASDPDHVICRAGEKTTGSLLSTQRVCHTQREWDQMREQARHNLEMQQNRGMEAGRPGG